LVKDESLFSLTKKSSKTPMKKMSLKETNKSQKSQGRFYLVREKSYDYSRTSVRVTTGQNSAAHERETPGVAGECGPGRGIPGSFFAFLTLAVLGAMGL
jgi:hypothetical protein